MKELDLRIKSNKSGIGCPQTNPCLNNKEREKEYQIAVVSCLINNDDDDPETKRVCLGLVHLADKRH